MEIDPLIKKAIQESCAEAGISNCTLPVTKFIERFVSNELQPAQINSSLQAIYQLMKESK